MFKGKLLTLRNKALDHLRTALDYQPRISTKRYILYKEEGEYCIFNKQTSWIKKVLDNPEYSTDLICKLADEVKLPLIPALRKEIKEAK